jgi:hypothetical protein
VNLILGGNVRAPLRERLYHRAVTVKRRHMKGGPAGLVAGVDELGVVREEAVNPRDVRLFRRRARKCSGRCRLPDAARYFRFFLLLRNAAISDCLAL